MILGNGCTKDGTREDLDLTVIMSIFTATRRYFSQRYMTYKDGSEEVIITDHSTKLTAKAAEVIGDNGA